MIQNIWDTTYLLIGKDSISCVGPLSQALLGDPCDFPDGGGVIVITLGRLMFEQLLKEKWT